MLALVALGGAIGAIARYGVWGWIQGAAGTGFPWGTLVVNVVGSFLLGLLVAVFQGAAVAPETRAFLTVGVLGAFTTFSTFSYETVLLAQEGYWARAAAYSGGSLAVGVLAVLAGMAAGGVVLRAAVGPGAP